MLRHIWSVLCSKSVIDKESNNVSLLEVLEQVDLELSRRESGARPSGLYVVFEWITLWAREEPGKPSVGRARDLVLDPSGEVIGEKEYDVDLTKYERTRVRRKISQPPLQKSGEYRFCTQIKDELQNVWKDASSIPLAVTVKWTEAKQT